MQSKGALVNSTTENTPKTSTIQQRTVGGWFGRVLQHPARKCIGPISQPQSPHGAQAPEPAWSHCHCTFLQNYSQAQINGVELLLHNI